MGKPYQKGKTSLDLNEARYNGVLGCSGISWTISKQSVPHSGQITTPTPHHSVFYRPDALPDAQPVVYWGVYAGIRRIPTSGFFLTAYTHLSDHK